ncbi:hypothetical protein AVEN_159549-1 [Araneus ventricosus]|uniref:Uncharacterized protein n=1 Tax=Araneus ventricosus TaxID=182803 RepID=A0A4Y2R994_ARAVE|nr:hypothetical protein AVEN_159549-1 [Araneus ventricosus]
MSAFVESPAAEGGRGFSHCFASLSKPLKSKTREAPDCDSPVPDCVGLYIAVEKYLVSQQSNPSTRSIIFLRLYAFTSQARHSKQTRHEISFIWPRLTLSPRKYPVLQQTNPRHEIHFHLARSTLTVQVPSLTGKQSVTRSISVWSPALALSPVQYQSYSKQPSALLRSTFIWPRLYLYPEAASLAASNFTRSDTTRRALQRLDHGNTDDCSVMEMNIGNRAKRVQVRAPVISRTAFLKRRREESADIYIVYGNDRDNAPGGGRIIAVDKSWPSSRMAFDNIPNSDCEILGVKLLLQHCPY